MTNDQILLPKGVRLGALAMALCGALAALAALAPEARAQQVQAATQSRDYAIPAQPLGAALNRFADASDLRIMVPPDLVRGKAAAALNGSFTVPEALRTLLEGSGLGYRTTDSGVIVIVSEQAREPKAKKDPPEGKSIAAPDDAPAKELPEITVTGTRLRSILGSQEANPVLVYTREDIERSGVTTLSELRNLIPQLSVGAAASFDGNSSNGTPEGRLLFDIRGLQPVNTLLLVDGQRIPMTSQRNLFSAYEATNIPLSAIERVEVLLGGGSAIYGSDAVGGVVNIITRRGYSGTEVEYARDDTFDTDAANDRLSLSHAFQGEKFGMNAFVSRETQNALANRDRWWLASNDRRHIGGVDGTASAYPVGGRIMNAVDANLPGLDSRYAYIPRGSDGVNVTVEDYRHAPSTPNFDTATVTNALNPFRRDAASLRAEYRFAPWAEVFTNYSYSMNESWAPNTPLSINTYTLLPAGYAGNPFGVPIYVTRYLWDMDPPISRYALTSKMFSVGARGDLPADWRYIMQFNRNSSSPDYPKSFWALDYTRLNAAVNGDNPPILLNDPLGADPNPEEFWQSLLMDASVHEMPLMRTGSLSFDGPLYSLPAGNIKLAVGAERRLETVSISRNFANSMEAPDQDNSRAVNAQFIEMSVPVFSPSFGFPMLRELTIGGAIRRDDYDYFGAPRKTMVNVLYKPFSWMSLRASRNESFRVPYLTDLTRSRRNSLTNVPASGNNALIDIYRDNEPYVGWLPTVLGGNPDLKPENSISRNYGLILASPFEGKWIEGLSLSVDRWSTEILDRVGNVTIQEMLFYFPETFERAELTDADRAAGYTVGRISRLENVSRNIALMRAAGFDYALQYRVDSDVGQFFLDARATTTDRRELWVTPDAEEPSPGISHLLSPTRIVSTFSWQHRGMGASLANIRQDGFPVSLYSYQEYLPTETWNANFWYDFRYGTFHNPGGLMARVLGKSRVSFGLINATNAEPPISVTGNLNNSIDPRLRRYTFSLRYSF